MSGKEYPNNYEFVLASEFNETLYADFMDNMSAWLIPSSHSCIMRVENKKTGKIKEYSYRTDRGAANRIIQLADDPANIITIADNESIHLLKYPDDYDESAHADATAD